ncbi:MAG: type II toxin-antitoxin system VapB family antitoxin [Verrucomicrobia bacterium]|nr:type II toxin-antitoxin system VapB family antitoxin [Verrucomicrobiota bacterium]
MSVTLTIDEALLREAEKATHIHDWPTLVTTGLQALCQVSQSVVAAGGVRDF